MTAADRSNPWEGKESLRRTVLMLHELSRIDAAGMAAQIPAVLAGEMWRTVPTFTGTKHFETFAEFCEFAKMPAPDLIMNLRIGGFDAEAEMVSELVAEQAEEPDPR